MYHVQFPKLGWSFDIDPIAFLIGGLNVYWYGVIISIGFLVAFLYAVKNSRRFGLDANRLIDCIIVGLVTGIIGARLFYVIFYPGDIYHNDPTSIFYIQQGGLAIYGGIIGGLLGGIGIAKLKRLNIFACLDLAALGFLIGQGIGRWGNFVNQEAFGTPTDLPWGMLSENTLYESLLPVHPCFLYESIWCILGFVLLHLFSLKKRKYDGQIFLMYIVWYGMERFFVEGLRTDSLLIPGIHLRVSQVIAVLTALTGIVLLVVFRNRNQLCVTAMHSVETVEEIAQEAVEKSPTKPSFTRESVVSKLKEMSEQYIKPAIDKSKDYSKKILSKTKLALGLDTKSKSYSSNTSNNLELKEQHKANKITPQKEKSNHPFILFPAGNLEIKEISKKDISSKDSQKLETIKEDPITSPATTKSEVATKSATSQNDSSKDVDTTKKKTTTRKKPAASSASKSLTDSKTPSIEDVSSKDVDTTKKKTTTRKKSAASSATKSKTTAKDDNPKREV